VEQILYVDKNELKTTFWVLKFRENVWLCPEPHWGAHSSGELTALPTQVVGKGWTNCLFPKNPLPARSSAFLASLFCPLALTL